MATARDIADATLRSALIEAETSLDEGRYAEVVRRCVDAYLALLSRRPDLAPPATPPDGQHLYGVGDPGTVPAGPGRPSRRIAWPAFGTRFLLGEDEKPSIVFDKERFSLAEAATYFEFTVEQVLRSQRE